MGELWNTRFTAFTAERNELIVPNAGNPEPRHLFRVLEFLRLPFKEGKWVREMISLSPAALLPNPNQGLLTLELFFWMKWKNSFADCRH